LVGRFLEPSKKGRSIWSMEGLEGKKK